MKIDHPKLTELLQMAYSAEKAAAFAYIGHAHSLKNKVAIAAINQIEEDEWGHREEVLLIMEEYEIPISKWYEFKFHVIGKIIAFSCHIIGWFMPYYFAGRLESGNVCEYFRMLHFFHELGIDKHDVALYAMGVKEKEHEDFFLNEVKDSKLLPLFEKLFSWGKNESFNDVDLKDLKSTEQSNTYCKKN